MRNNRLEPHRFVEPGFELPHRLIHDDNGRTFVDADDAAQPLVELEDIPGAQFEWIR
jgi:hypothetical protein